MDIIKLVRKNISELKPYTSARGIYNNPKGVLLDANENNLGTTFNEISGLNLNRYPDPHQEDLKTLLETYLGLKKENLFFGVGSDEIIDLLIRIFCNPGVDNVIIPEPTYGMYKVACDINNIETLTVLLNDNFQLNFSALDKVYNEKTKMVFLCSPNNPTGNLLNKKDILSLCNKLNAIIVVDEAYIDFCQDSSIAGEINNYPNLVVLRTFSKAWGLAGLRLGYCIANKVIINILHKIKAPYNIGSVTRYIIKQALSNILSKNEYVKTIITERVTLKNKLENLPGVITVFDSNANYLLVKVKNAKDLQNKLYEKGIIVRDRSTQPKLEGCIRISIGTEGENNMLLNALRNIL